MSDGQIILPRSVLLQLSTCIVLTCLFQETQVHIVKAIVEYRDARYVLTNVQRSECLIYS